MTKYSFLKSAYDRLLYSVMKHIEDGEEFYFSLSDKDITVNNVRIGGVNIEQNPDGKVPAMLTVYDLYGEPLVERYDIDGMDFWEKLEQEIIKHEIEL